MTEQWRAVVGYEGFYEVSDLGRVRSLHTGKVRAPGKLKSGYRVVPLYKHGVQQNNMLSRLVLAAFVGVAPTEAHQAAHNNGDVSDNTLENLRWATPTENNADKKRHGTDVVRVGESLGRGVLTAHAVDRIRDLRKAGHTLQAIADWVGTANSNVCYVLQGRTWSHV